MLDRLLASPPKILRRLFCHELGAAPPTTLGLVAGVYVLSPLAMGPPGRAHGGAVITICTDVMGYLVHREGGGPLMSNTVSLEVEYLGATPLSAPVIAVSRVVGIDGRLATTKAVLWDADAFFSLPNPYEDCWLVARSTTPRSPRSPRPIITATATWVPHRQLDTTVSKSKL